MKAARKADLETLLRHMRAATENFTRAARTIGLDTLIDYANRAVVYVETCNAKLARGEDFTDYSPRSDILKQLHETEVELRIAQQHLAVLEPLRDDFRNHAYDLVQEELQAHRLWVSPEGGDWITTPSSGRLADAVRELVEQRGHRTVVLARPAAPGVQPAPTPTQQPQDFRLPGPPVVPDIEMPGDGEKEGG